jgi:hypothetical protein
MQVDLGNIRNVESNVRYSEGLPALAEHDLHQGYIQAGSNLFRSNIDAKLPSPDDDLVFMFSSLPAFVERTCGPPRNTNPEVFRSLGAVVSNGSNTADSIKDIPSAVQASANMDVSLQKGDARRPSVEVVSTGTTCGALPEQD